MEKLENYNFRVYGYYNLLKGNAEYAIYKMKDYRIVEKKVGGFSWSSDKYHLAEAVCKQLNNQTEKIGK